MITVYLIHRLAATSSYEGRIGICYTALSLHEIDYEEFKKLDDFFCVPLIDFSRDDGKNYDKHNWTERTGFHA